MLGELGPLAIPAAAAAIAKQATALGEEQLAARLGLFPISHDLLREAAAQLVETEHLCAFFGRMANGGGVTSLAGESSPPAVPPPQLVGAAAEQAGRGGCGRRLSGPGQNWTDMVTVTVQD